MSGGLTVYDEPSRAKRRAQRITRRATRRVLPRSRWPKAKIVTPGHVEGFGEETVVRDWHFHAGWFCCWAGVDTSNPDDVRLLGWSVDELRKRQA